MTSDRQDRLGEFSAVVGAIYDAALDETLWIDALHHVRVFLNSKTAVFQSYDLFDNNPLFDQTVGYEPQWIQSLHERYGALNPYMDMVAGLAPGEVDYSSVQPDYADLLVGPFYLEWLKPQGLIDGVVMIVDKSVTTIATLVAVRNEDQGVFSPDVVDQMQLLYPHVRRALLIGGALKKTRTEVAELSRILDALPTGMLTLTAQGDIVRANAAAQAMLERRAPIERFNGRLQLPGAQANRALADALRAVGDLAFGAGPPAIPIRPRTGEAFMLHMLPLTAERRLAIDADRDATVVVFVRPVHPAHQQAADALTERYGLTPQERRVAQALIDVGGAPMVADVLGLAPSTVRSHITAIFDKTGVRRQADLIRLMMELRSPFSG